MPSYRNIARPEEWITDTDRMMADAIRKWVDNEVWPNRRKIDDDWAEHAVGPRMSSREDVLRKSARLDPAAGGE